MNLKIGIVGLPNVGKSTLFKILTKQDINIANYPFATIDPNIGIVFVPDNRLEKLAEISKSKEIIPAVVQFYDIAGLVRGAYKGEGLGNQFLGHIKETEAIVIVLRVFQNSEIIHIESTVNPLRDLEIINQELIFKDLDLVSRYLIKLEKEAKAGDKNSIKNLPILKKIFERLNQGNLILEFKDEEIVRELNLLTAKKQIYLLNGDENEVSEDLILKIKNLGADYLVKNLAKIEEIPELIQKAYEVLDLISFFTTGEKETRAWTIKKGTKAKEAAGVIHSDFEKNFIRLEVLAFNDFINCGGWNNAKQKGLVRIEGKDYILKDGDIVIVRHNA
ncbi:MAG: ribosome-binding ATPase YchF [Candidatus Parcubacteria bacterium]|nr:MAG: ribosome-binding ATPase YchF [Candidatus Parcubacteria bacterium]